MSDDKADERIEGGVIKSPHWPDGCPLTLDEMVSGGDAFARHTNCERKEKS